MGAFKVVLRPLYGWGSEMKDNPTPEKVKAQRALSATGGQILA
jgi:hypothetical protein